MKYLGHSFIKDESNCWTIDKNARWYKCKICSIRLYDFYGKRPEKFICCNDGWVVPNLSCEEFIIKKLLE